MLCVGFAYKVTLSAPLYSVKNLKDLLVRASGTHSTHSERTMKAVADLTYLPHQETALRWMMEHEDDPYELTGEEPSYICGGILADEMGLGKTISVVGLMLNNPVPSTLIVAPIAVLNQWADLLQKAGVIVFQQNGSDWKLIRTPEIPNTTAAYLTNYERILASPSATHSKSWDRLVMDEAHKARNHLSQTFKQLVSIQAIARWALTGTPVVNKLKDLANLYILIGAPSHLTNSAAQDITPHLMLARRRSQVPDGMPSDPKIITSHIDFRTEEEAAFYKGIQGQLSSRWKRLSSRSGMDNTMAILVLLLRLRQISVHPQVYINSKKAKNPAYDVDDWTYSCSKFEHVMELIHKSKDKDGTVIFCSFREEMELFAKRIGDEANTFMYYGGQDQSARQGQINGAKASVAEGTKPTIFLVQIHAGGTGLNLQFMNRVIFMSPWWTAALMDQAVARVVRYGQKKPVEVHHIHLKGEMDGLRNIDRVMYKTAEMKRSLCEQVIASADTTV